MARIEKPLIGMKSAWWSVLGGRETGREQRTGESTDVNVPGNESYGQ